MRIRKGEKTQWEYFFAKVDKDGPVPPHNPQIGKCWLWLGSKRRTGHGYFQFDGRIDSAYRFAFMFTGHAIPNGFELGHMCDRGDCVNPDHLEVITHGKNILDAVDRGQIPTGERCSWAKLTAENVIEIRRSLAEGSSQTSLAVRFGVSQKTISAIHRGKIWKQLPMPAA